MQRDGHLNCEVQTASAFEIRAHIFVRGVSAKLKSHRIPNPKLANPPINPEMLFEESVHVQDILLQVALGHSLIGSKSCLAGLSKDIIQHALAKAIEESYWKSRSQEGLLTPKPMAKAKKAIFCIEIPDELKCQAMMRRAVVRPIVDPRLFHADQSDPSTCTLSASNRRDMILCPVGNLTLSASSTPIQSPRRSLMRKTSKH